MLLLTPVHHNRLDTGHLFPGWQALFVLIIKLNLNAFNDLAAFSDLMESNFVNSTMIPKTHVLSRSLRPTLSQHSVLLWFSGITNVVYAPFAPFQ